jgi:hypothetical protein
MTFSYELGRSPLHFVKNHHHPANSPRDPISVSLGALAIGLIPGLSIDRAGIALVGASLMVASGALSLDGAYKADRP